MKSIIEAFALISKASTYTKEGERYQGADGLIYCAKCNTPLQKPINFGDKVLNMPIMCKCQTLQEEHERRVLSQQNHEVEIEKLREFGFNNRFYLDCTFQNDDKANPQISMLAQDYVKKFEQFKSNGLGMLFYGDTGTGKTYISACIGNALIEKEYSVYMTSIADLINLMTKNYGNYRQEVLENLSKVDLLILDDLGTENILTADTNSSKQKEFLELTYKIIDSRYLTKKPLIVSTNYDAHTLQNPPTLDIKRIFERITERCRPILMNGANRRGKQSYNNQILFDSILNGSNQNLGGKPPF